MKLPQRMRLRRAIVARAAAAVGAACAALLQPVAAQPQQSTKPLRIVVPYPAGGVVDALVRRVGQQVGETLGRTVIVDNRPGANTVIGLAACARSAPDGNTLCASSADGMSYNPVLYAKLPYSPEADFAPISQLVWVPGVIVANPALPFDTVTGMLAYAKAKPGVLNFASFGTGSTAHLYAEWFRNQGRADIVHVPYKGSAETLPAVMSGEAHATFVAMGIALPLIQAGRLKALAVTAPQRAPQLPAVPTLAEQQIDPRIRNWFGIFAPAGTAPALVQQFGAAFVKVLHDPALTQGFLKQQGYDAVGSTPAEFAAFLAGDRAQARQVVGATGIQPESSPGAEPPAAR